MGILLNDTDLRGSFDGVGIQVDVKDCKLTVVSPIEGSPAEAAGLVTKTVQNLGFACRTETVNAVEAWRGAVLDPEVIAHMLGRRRREPAALERLSERERDVLAQMAEGASNHAIARRMFLSERAIERHVSAIFDALGLPRCRTTHRRVLAVLAHLGAT